MSKHSVLTNNPAAPPTSLGQDTEPPEHLLSDCPGHPRVGPAVPRTAGRLNGRTCAHRTQCGGGHMLWPRERRGLFLSSVLKPAKSSAPFSAQSPRQCDRLRAAPHGSADATPCSWCRVGMRSAPTLENTLCRPAWSPRKNPSNHTGERIGIIWSGVSVFSGIIFALNRKTSK